MFIHLDKAPERDGRTDRQTARSCYSGLHCEQCGRAVKTNKANEHVDRMTLHYITVTYSGLMYSTAF